MEDKTINLCDTCLFCFGTCEANFDEVGTDFGNGIGFENVYQCKTYINKED